MAPRRRSALGVNPNSAGAAATVPRCARSSTRVATHDEVKRQHAAGPLRVLAIRPFPAAARGRTRCPKTDCTASSLGSCTPTPATPAFAAGPTESRSQERNTGRTNTSVSAALGLIGYAKRIDDPVSSTTAARRSGPPMRSRPSTRPSPPHRSGPSGRFVASTRRCGRRTPGSTQTTPCWFCGNPLAPNEVGLPCPVCDDGNGRRGTPHARPGRTGTRAGRTRVADRA